MALNPELDTLNYTNDNNSRARAELTKQMADNNLLDIYRELNPLEEKFTWRKWGRQKLGRLDYFLISNSLLPFVQKTEIQTACFSDHSPILLEIDFAKFKRGRGVQITVIAKLSSFFTAMILSVGRRCISGSAREI